MATKYMMEDIDHRSDKMKKVNLNQLSHNVGNQEDCNISAANPTFVKLMKHINN